jgi:hypothetical protein
MITLTNKSSNYIPSGVHLVKFTSIEYISEGKTPRIQFEVTNKNGQTNSFSMWMSQKALEYTGAKIGHIFTRIVGDNDEEGDKVVNGTQFNSEADLVQKLIEWAKGKYIWMAFHEKLSYKGDRTYSTFSDKFGQMVERYVEGVEPTLTAPPDEVVTANTQSAPANTSFNAELASELEDDDTLPF